SRRGSRTSGRTRSKRCDCAPTPTNSPCTTTCDGLIRHCGKQAPTAAHRSLTEWAARRSLEKRCVGEWDGKIPASVRITLLYAVIQTFTESEGCPVGHRPCRRARRGRDPLPRSACGAPEPVCVWSDPSVRACT